MIGGQAECAVSRDPREGTNALWMVGGRAAGDTGSGGTANAEAIRDDEEWAEPREAAGEEIGE